MNNKKEYFELNFNYSRTVLIDAFNLNQLKNLLLLNKSKWFKISQFETQADNDAWLVVQHADHDRKFQKKY